jgi:hypothetical protein
LLAKIQAFPMERIAEQVKHEQRPQRADQAAGECHEHDSLRILRHGICGSNHRGPDSRCAEGIRDDFLDFAERWITYRRAFRVGKFAAMTWDQIVTWLVIPAIAAAAIGFGGVWAARRIP